MKDVTPSEPRICDLACRLEQQLWKEGFGKHPLRIALLDLTCMAEPQIHAAFSVIRSIRTAADDALQQRLEEDRERNRKRAKKAAATRVAKPAEREAREKAFGKTKVGGRSGRAQLN